jgi:hypothetical protein
MGLFDSQPGQLSSAEAATNRGDWDFCQTSHYALFQRHLEKGDIRQATEHLRQLAVAMSGHPERKAGREQIERLLRLLELHICMGVAAADTDTLEDASSIGPALQEMEHLVQGVSDPDERELLRWVMESTREVARLEPSSRPDADGWKRIRDDLQKLVRQVPLSQSATAEDMRRRFHISSTACELVQRTWELQKEGKACESLASLDELEKLCQEEPVAMFIVDGGQATIDLLRAGLLLKLSAAQAQRVRMERRLERWTPFILVVGSWLLSLVVDWLWPPV